MGCCCAAPGYSLRQTIDDPLGTHIVSRRLIRSIEHEAHLAVCQTLGPSRICLLSFTLKVRTVAQASLFQEEIGFLFGLTRSACFKRMSQSRMHSMSDGRQASLARGGL